MNRLSGMIMNIEENGLDIIELDKTDKKHNSEIEQLKQDYAQLQKEKEDLELKYQNLEKRIAAFENK